MKNISKTLGSILAASTMLFTGFAKKPVRTMPDATSLGAQNNGLNGINPEQVAVADTSSTLQARDASLGTPDASNKSVVDPIYFALDQAAVPSAERPKLKAAVKWLADNPTQNLVLVGHCDWRGTAEYNLGLGDRRANAVKRFLESLNVNPARLETLSKGSTEAVQTGGEAQWKKDRRVDFVILTK